MVSAFKKIVFSVSAAVALCGCCKTSDGHTYRVEDIGGVPRLTIDGEPQRARMLYVSPTYFLLGSPVRRTAFNYDWCETFFEIQPLEKPLENGSLKLTFRKGICKTFDISKFEILEAQGGKKVCDFCNGKTRSENAEVPLKIGQINLEAGKKYRVNLTIKSDKTADYTLEFFDKNGRFVAPQTRSYVGLQTEVAKNAGVDMITFPVQAADFFAEGDIKPNYENLRGALDEIVAANPNAKILVRIRFYPPQWWMKKYKDDVMTSSEGKQNDFASPSSERFRADCEKALNLVIDFCEKNYGKNIMGYHPGGGGSSEWYYGNAWGPRWFGYGVAEKAAWKNWLAKKYETDQALQNAWNNPNASLSTVEVPRPERRALSKYVLDPASMRDIADFNLFLQDEMLGIIERLAAAIKRKVPDKICAFFYGYVCDYAGSYRKGPSTTGHYALEKLLRSPNIDILSGPTTYTERDLGDGSTVMTVGETVTRAGKIWFSEDDIRTHRTPASQQKVSALNREIKTLEQSRLVLGRDLAQQAIRNFGCWWMDLAGTGWYDDPAMWETMKQFAPVERDMTKNPVKYQPPIAVIGDERSMVFVGVDGTSRKTSEIFSRSRFDLNRLATPFGHYLLNDVLFGKPTKAKLLVFATAYALDAKQQKAMRKKSKNRAAIFVWIPSYIDADKMEFSAEAVKRATGFDVAQMPAGTKANVVPTADGENIGLTKFGFDEAVKPLLSPAVKDGDKILATYENGSPAVVLRGRHLFCGVSQIPPPLYRYMIKISGAHMYSQQPLCVYASGAYISVTCIDKIETPHDIELDIPSDREVFDALTGEKLGKAPKLVLKMKSGDFRLLRLGNGNADFAKKPKD